MEASNSLGPGLHLLLQIGRQLFLLMNVGGRTDPDGNVTRFIAHAVMPDSNASDTARRNPRRYRFSTTKIVPLGECPVIHVPAYADKSSG